MRGLELSITAVLTALALYQPAFETPEPKPAPEPGWVTQALVTDVYDGDTCTIVVTKRFKCRIGDCWAPELREPGGRDSGDFLRRRIEGRNVMVRFRGGQDVWRNRTFGRDVCDVWHRGQDMAHYMIDHGHAFPTKAALRDALEERVRE